MEFDLMEAFDGFQVERAVVSLSSALEDRDLQHVVTRHRANLGFTLAFPLIQKKEQ
jgi:hypothetical protein